jgi:membrane-bound serine protease (ClpP class)
MDGLAANWEILLFLIGLVLVALELFVIPGFGISGISGITLIIAGLTLSLLNNVDFNFEPVKTGAIGKALLTVIGGTTMAFVLILYLSSKIGSKGIFRKMALTATLNNEDGFVGVSMENTLLIGKFGIASTVLRPSGKVSVDGTVHDAVSVDGFVEKGEKIKIIRYETGQVYVEKI